MGFPTPVNMLDASGRSPTWGRGAGRASGARNKAEGAATRTRGGESEGWVRVLCILAPFFFFAGGRALGPGSRVSCVPGAAAGTATLWRGRGQGLCKGLAPALRGEPECSLRGGQWRPERVVALWGFSGGGRGALPPKRTGDTRTSPPLSTPQPGCAISVAHVAGLRHFVRFGVGVACDIELFFLRFSTPVLATRTFLRKSFLCIPISRGWRFCAT